MPQKTRSKPPPRMTWGKAAPVLVVSGVFDALRGACSLFWFLWPALAAAYCTSAVGDWLSGWTFGLFGTGTAAAACAAGGLTLGAAAFPAFATIGTVLAMAVGLLGWMVVGLWTLISNGRLVREHPAATVWLIGSLLVSEVPFVNSLPTLTISMWRLYRIQIRADKQAYKKWEQARAAEAKRDQRQAEAAAAQASLAQAANDASYREEAGDEAETDDSDMPFERRRTRSALASVPSYGAIPQADKKAA